MRNYNELIEEAHGNAIERGFYPEGENKNIGELLMLIVSELGEALEAHRCGRFALKNETTYFVTMFTLDNVKKDHIWISEFESKIKDTFEDEIADVFIRLFDLCGNLGIENLYSQDDIYVDHKNIGNLLLRCTTFICNIFHAYLWDKKRLDIEISRNINYLSWLCEIWDIPIEKHIKAKMAYNRTREHKHGKQY